MLEFFFINDFETIEELTDHLKNKYNPNDFELYIARGDTYAHGVKINESIYNNDVDLQIMIECLKSSF